MPNRLDQYSNRQPRLRINPNDPYADLHRKLRRIMKLRQKINGAKGLYLEHDRLMEEVLPYFIRTEHDRFVVLRVLNLSGHNYRVAPFFYDEQRGQLRAKTWKATAHETFTIS